MITIFCYVRQFVSPKIGVLFENHWYDPFYAKIAVICVTIDNVYEFFLAKIFFLNHNIDPSTFFSQQQESQ
jgi:hypothetical protein